jgi:osmotically inducible protein OsmC
MKVLYTAEATATGGREGRTSSSDGNIDVQLSIPSELGGPGTPGTTNPEQLFAVGYASCFHSAVKRIAKQRDLPADASSVTARVGFGPAGGGSFGLTVDLLVRLPGVDRAAAEAVAARAHEVCPYSNATRGNIPVEVTVLEPAAV